MMGAMHRSVLSLVICAVLAAIGFLFSNVDARAEPVSIRAGVHEGHGRLVFNWPAPASYEVEIGQGTASFRFSRPIETEFSLLRRSLARYVADARVEPDGRTVTLRFNGNPQIAHYYSGRAVVVDIFDQQAASSTPPSQPAPSTVAAPQASADMPVIGVRSGEHEGFSRLVFDWPSQVAYSIDRQGDELAIAFAAPARINIDPIRRFPPRNVRGLSGGAAAERPTVAVTVPDGARVRDFVTGSKVVLDIYGQGTAPASQPSAPPPAAPQPAAPTPAAPPAPVEVTDVSPPPTESPVAEASQETESASAEPAVAAPDGQDGPAAPVAVVPEQEVAATEPAPIDLSTPAPNEPADVVAETPSGTSTPVPEDAGNQPLDLTPPADAGAAGAGEAAEVEIEEALPDDGEVIVRMRFDWDEPVAAAVFRRGGFLWVVFDKVGTPDLGSLLSQGGNLVRDIRSMPVDQATALRLDTITGVNPRMRRDGLAWILEFRQQAVQVATPIETQSQPNSPVGARVFMPITEPGRALAIGDPDIGDNLVVIPIVPLGHGVAEARNFPQFELLPTLQGVVVRPRIDDLRVRSLRQGIELTGAGGLALSSVSARQQADLKLGGLRPLTRVFELDRWHDVPLSDARDQRQALLHTIARAVGAEKEERRKDLAQFFLSLGFEAEALGVIKAIEIDRPDAASEPVYRALRGAANLLMGRFDDASVDLDHESLDDNDEGNFLRAALKAARGDLAGAASTLKRTNGIMRPYPMPVKLPLGLYVAESAIEVGDIRLASQVLDILLSEEPDAKQQAQIGYVLGRIHELGGDSDGAIVTWEEVMESKHRPSRARAAVARAELLMKTEEITREAGIEMLEELRFSWRGDTFEFDLLRRLGDLYLADGQYRDGLRTMRQAATYFRERPAATDVTRKMASTFESMYQGEDAEQLAPLTAIALYEEFKELTPSGEKGDAMVRSLVEKMVAVDLLGQAADLLDNQVAFRLQGQEKAQVGMRLAEIRLLNRQPDAAFKALEDTDVEDMEADLAVKRRYLAARALQETGRGVEALDLLDKDDSLEADLLRLEHFWNGQEWPKAASVMRRVVEASGIERGQPLDAEQARQVLNLSVALTLAGNQRAVNRMRRDYGVAMEASPYKDAFELIASNQAQGLADYRTIAGKVAVAENFQSFMASYRERLKAQEASSVN